MTRPVKARSKARVSGFGVERSRISHSRGERGTTGSPVTGTCTTGHADSPPPPPFLPLVTTLVFFTSLRVHATRRATIFCYSFSWITQTLRVLIATKGILIQNLLCFQQLEGCLFVCCFVVAVVSMNRADRLTCRSRNIILKPEQKILHVVTEGLRKVDPQSTNTRDQRRATRQ